MHSVSKHTGIPSWDLYDKKKKKNMRTQQAFRDTCVFSKIKGRSRKCSLVKSFFKKNYVLSFSCMTIQPARMSVCHVRGLVPMEARRGHQISRSYKWLWAAMWVPGTEPGSSGRVASAQNQGPCSSPLSWFLNVQSLPTGITFNTQCFRFVFMDASCSVWVILS